ncbi:MAG: 4-oxalocrotonate tautomerase family protein [Candidatus Aminicenantaceae bacterium]
MKNLAKKRRLAQRITEGATKAYAVPKEAIVVIIKENSPENVSVGGKLLIDRKQ